MSGEAGILSGPVMRRGYFCRPLWETWRDDGRRAEFHSKDNSRRWRRRRTQALDGSGWNAPARCVIKDVSLVANLTSDPHCKWSLVLAFLFLFHFCILDPASTSRTSWLVGMETYIRIKKDAAVYSSLSDRHTHTHVHTQTQWQKNCGSTVFSHSSTGEVLWHVCFRQKEEWRDAGNATIRAEPCDSPGHYTTSTPPALCTASSPLKSFNSATKAKHLQHGRHKHTVFTARIEAHKQTTAKWNCDTQRNEKKRNDAEVSGGSALSNSQIKCNASRKRRFLTVPVNKAGLQPLEGLYHVPPGNSEAGLLGRLLGRKYSGKKIVGDTIP